MQCKHTAMCVITSNPSRVRTIHKKTGQDWFSQLDRPSQYLVHYWWMAMKYAMFPADDSDKLAGNPILQ